MRKIIAVTASAVLATVYIGRDAKRWTISSAALQPAPGLVRQPAPPSARSATTATAAAAQRPVQRSVPRWAHWVATSGTSAWRASRSRFSKRRKAPASK